MGMIDKLLRATSVEGDIREDHENTFEGRLFKAYRIKYKTGGHTINIVRVINGNNVPLSQNASEFVASRIAEVLTEYKVPSGKVSIVRGGTKDNFYIQIEVKDPTVFGFAYNQFIKDVVNKLNTRSK